MIVVSGNCQVVPCRRFVALSTWGFAPQPRNSFGNYRNELRMEPLVWCAKQEEVQDGYDHSGSDSILPRIVEEQVEELLKKEENRVLLDGLEKASERVENVRRQLGDAQREELEAKQLREYVNSLEARASEIAESQREISEARSMIENAERFLYSSLNESSNPLNSERLESGKAILVSAMAGTLTGLPIYATRVTSLFELVLPSAITFISCALFGVTFRYAVRRDVDDVHLKSGTIAAFAFVKGLGMLAGGSPLEPNAESFLSHVLDGSLSIAENLLVFASAAISVDFCFKMGIVSPFPMAKSLANRRSD